MKKTQSDTTFYRFIQVPPQINKDISPCNSVWIQKFCVSFLSCLVLNREFWSQLQWDARRGEASKLKPGTCHFFSLPWGYLRIFALIFYWKLTGRSHRWIHWSSLPPTVLSVLRVEVVYPKDYLGPNQSTHFIPLQKPQRPVKYFFSYFSNCGCNQSPQTS